LEGDYTEHPGDRVPAEASKYLQFIVDNYDRIETYKNIVFLQADPFPHSPDIVKLLQLHERFKTPFQGLTFGYLQTFEKEVTKRTLRPPPATLKPKAASIKNKRNAHRTTPWGENSSRETDRTHYLGGLRLWCDPMRNDFQNVKWIDEGTKNVLAKITRISPPWSPAAKGVKEFCAYYGIDPPRGQLIKWHAAHFAVTPSAIRALNMETWKKIWTDAKVPGELGKLFAILMEYMWCPLLTR
jgi:hypothetical protein